MSASGRPSGHAPSGVDQGTAAVGKSHAGAPTPIPGRATSGSRPLEREAHAVAPELTSAPVSSREGPLHRLTDILRALPESEIEALIKRMGIRIDPAKRIDVPSQVARALVGIPDVRDPTRLPAPSRELLHRIAEAGGLLLVPSLPAGLEPLVARGVVYARKLERAIQLVLPSAFLVQLKAWESEDPRSMRALLSQAPFETVSAIASHYLGRPATPPVALSLEIAWEVLRDRRRLAEEIEKLAPVERRLLDAIESVGGEVDTAELLDLEREPMRLRGAGGVTASRRGAGFALERRGLLIPIHPNRHVIPAEVAAIVGAERTRARESQRARIRSFVLSEDHAPRRARFAADPAPLAIALACAVREPGTEVRAGVGTPRSLLTRLAQRFGREVDAVALVAALSRAIGLWEPSAASPATPPGSYAIHELTQVLFATWRRGGAWDEARADREALRVAAESRDASPIGALREMVLEALQHLGENRWVPWEALEGYLAADARIPGIERLLRRWAERSSVEAPDPLEVARRVVLETLPVLGIIDLGGADDLGGAERRVGSQAAMEAVTDGAIEARAPARLGAGTALRLTPRGRALLAGMRPTLDPSPSKFEGTQVLRVGTSARVANVLVLSHFAELGRVSDHVDLVLTPPSIARALSVGVDAEALRARIEAIAPLPDTLSRMLIQASVVVGRASLVTVSGFLWVDDPEIRELLRTHRPASELFLDPSPPGGLLVAPDVDLEKLVRRCRALGVEVEVDPSGAPRAKAVQAAEPGGRGSSAMRPRVKTPMPRSR